MKTTPSAIGGSLTPSAYFYNEYGEFLWGYFKYLQQTFNLSMYAVSIFNEPDAQVYFESMNEDAAQTAEIVAAVGSFFQAKEISDPTTPRPKLVTPDCSNSTVSISYLQQILSTNASSYLDITGSHYYFGVASDWDTLANLSQSRPLWMTEVSRTTGATDNIDDAMVLNKWIHEVLGNGGNAYVAFQWVWQTNDSANGQGMIRMVNQTNYVVPKRYFAFKQWINTIPFDSVVIGSSSTNANLLNTVFMTQDNNTLIIQLSNVGLSTFYSNNFTIIGRNITGNVTRYRTSGTYSFVSTPAIVPLSLNLFQDDIFPWTFTTYAVSLQPLSSAPSTTGQSTTGQATTQESTTQGTTGQATTGQATTGQSTTGQATGQATTAQGGTTQSTTQGTIGQGTTSGGTTEASTTDSKISAAGSTCNSLRLLAACIMLNGVAV